MTITKLINESKNLGKIYKPFYVLINDFAQVSGYELYYSPDGLTWNTLPLPPNTDGKKNRKTILKKQSLFDSIY